jgi:hypothetical protein
LKWLYALDATMITAFSDMMKDVGRNPKDDGHIPKASGTLLIDVTDVKYFPFRLAVISD